jgi:Mannosyltransferase (PIG-V)
MTTDALRARGRVRAARERVSLGPAFRTVLGIRLAYWLAAAFALLWEPLRGTSISPFRAYGPISDLLFGTFAQWDSAWFIHIADHGYDSTQSSAFFPLYPLIVRGLASVLGSTVVAGTLVSLVAGSIGVAVVHRIARVHLTREGAWDTVLLMALYPLAFVFTAVYSDGLFLALSAGSFLAAMQRRPVAAGVLGGLAVATRLVGLALLPALVVLLWPRGRTLRDLSNLVPLVLLPLAVGLYGLYLRQHLGDAEAFVHAQGAFWNRRTPTLGPLSGLWDALTSGLHGIGELSRHLPTSSGSPQGFVHRDQWAAWNVAQFVVLVAAVWLTAVAWRRLGAAFGLYSAATLVVILSAPADLVPLVSLPRFLLADFPLFLALATFTEGRPRLRLGLLCSFAAVGGMAALAFSHHAWVA